MSSKKSFRARFDAWKKEENQHGKTAFARFVQLNFVDALATVTDKMVFKGGVLIWHYIKTPRATVDLDFTTTLDMAHDDIKAIFKKASGAIEGITFKLNEFFEVDKGDFVGSRAYFIYETQEGAKNKFYVDTVYELASDLKKIKTPLKTTEIYAVTIENIICDKVHASNKHKGNNTRMKDFDDLWRISKSDLKVSKTKLRKLLKKEGLKAELDKSWATAKVKEAWKRHQKVYKDLPNEIDIVFKEVNLWLKSFRG